jgi:hypothetical protein
VAEALEALQRPDPDSTHKDFEGRRLVEEEPNQWFAPAYPDYRKRMSEMRRRWKDKQRKRDERGQLRTDVDEDGQDGTKQDPVSVSVSVPVTVPVKDKKKGVVRGKKANTKPDYTDAFEAFWVQTWGRGNKKAAFAAWEAIEDEDMNAIVVAAGGWKVAFARREGGYVPHVSTWLNARGWEDDLDAELAKAKGAKGGFDPNVGATPKISEADRVRRRQQVRSAIAKHVIHLMDIEFDEPEVAAIVQEGIEKLKTLSETVCASEDAKELVEGFQEICDEMLLRIAKGWDPALREEWKKAALENGRTKDAQHRMYNALARRAVRVELGIKDVTDYDWVG